MERPEFSFRHVGINTGSAENMRKTAELFMLLFGQEIKKLPISLASGKHIEVMGENGLGANGHLGFNVRDINQAVEYLSSLGYEVDMDTARYTPEGEVKLVYLKEEIAGFAVHLFLEK